MRILLKIIFLLIGTILMTIGAFLAAAGYSDNTHQPSWRGDKFELTGAPIIINYVNPQLQKTLPREYKKFLKLRQHGSLYPLAIVGGLIVLIGFIFFTNGLFRFRKPKAIGHGDKIVMRQQSTGSASQKSKVVIDEDSVDEDEDAEELDDEEEESESSFEDIKYLISLLQGNVTADETDHLVRIYRSNLLEFLPLFSDDGASQLGYQIVQSIVFRHQRKRKDTTADQFQAQDNRINQCETKTFARRYMPRGRAMSADAEASIGRVYDLREQAMLQQKFGGESDDWADISLRNAYDMLSVKPPAQSTP